MTTQSQDAEVKVLWEALEGGTSQNLGGRAGHLHEVPAKLGGEGLKDEVSPGEANRAGGWNSHHQAVGITSPSRKGTFGRHS